MMMMERADRGGQLTAGHRCIVCQPPSRHTRRSSDISVTICQDRDETRPTKIYDAFHILRLHGTVTDTYIHIHTQSCKQTDGRTDRQTDRQVRNSIPSTVILVVVTLCHVPSYFQLEGTHRVQTHAVLLLTLALKLTFDLSTQNHVTCRISQGHSLYQV